MKSTKIASFEMFTKKNFVKRQMTKWASGNQDSSHEPF